MCCKRATFWTLSLKIETKQLLLVDGVDKAHIMIVCLLQALDEMQVQGHRPDVGIYNIALEVLTRSGVLSAQLKAAQLFQTATRQGQLRCV